MNFVEKYGPWAVIAGATEGIGRAFALELSRRGVSLLLLARREALLSTLADELRALGCPQVRTLAIDLGLPDVIERVRSVSDDVEVGLVIYNAALSVVGPFLECDIEQRLQELDVNCRGPLRFAHHFGRAMAARGRGGIVLMSSLSGKQGTALVTSYAASKAFNTVLAEGLWAELGERGVDVLVCEAGATRTPNFERSKPKTAGSMVSVMEPEGVAKAALAALGKQPAVIPGFGNRLGSIAMWLMPRRTAISLISATTRKMYGA